MRFWRKKVELVEGRLGERSDQSTPVGDVRARVMFEDLVLTVTAH